MTVEISVWSDIACPWCFVGKQRLDRALTLFSETSDVPVAIRWRSFELNPRPQAVDDRPYAERLAQKYGRSVTEAEQMIATMANTIAAEGGTADFGSIVVANTFDAHRLLHWAATIESQDAQVNAQYRLNDALMRAYLGSGLNVSDHEALLNLVGQLGLDVGAARSALSQNRFAQAVRDDEQLAQHYGISGVPFFVIGKYGMSGAQEADQLLAVLNRVVGEDNLLENSADNGPHCDDSGCEP
ncbi:DsbA family oxidoreductase [Simiduia aestuariiviva]|uniref:Putative DsbA family dithiol-disulfide isomerase n=1 Tax=Simiduia aestuariiviva TaxID=1510459 RepID=A0A839UJW8_9GAMM|nr:DsbA family oxidoreductase [Simiduia aestuariiviva]MBB3167893.1 putative DsbA family dithiol-disulfide isomerase [Simiduia aestuariiviva]